MNEGGIGFMMAPRYHPAMKIVGSVRKKLKVRTVFNILGPMLNPARAPFSVLGVYKEDLVSTSTEKSWLLELSSPLLELYFLFLIFI